MSAADNIVPVAVAQILIVFLAIVGLHLIHLDKPLFSVLSGCIVILGVIVVYAYADVSIRLVRKGRDCG